MGVPGGGFSEAVTRWWERRAREDRREEWNMVDEMI
jgi:hypothetical protein